ncbi:MAG: glycosyltransferase family 2 protein, partial [Bryobacteraceae bacterium]
RERATIIENRANVGFGAAVNQACRATTAPFLATLNDDAAAHPQWLESLLAAIDRRPEIGMCASRVLLAPDVLDSAGMLLCRDGSSKQRGHREPPSAFDHPAEVLCPSGSAALYRRAMLDEIGLFDESFFLYCEDTDLGLRARWAAWECRYVPNAIVDHLYSHSAGNASPLKAYYVERNRLFLVIRNFPAGMVFQSVFFAAARYFWHLSGLQKGKGKAAEFHAERQSLFALPMVVLRAHLATLRALPRLLRERRRIRRRLVPRQFQHMLASYSISPRKVAAL